MLRHTIIITAALGAASFAAQVNANFINDTIYDNGPPDYVEAGVSDSQWSFQFADNFSLEAGKNIVRDVHWYGAYWRDRAMSGFTSPTQNDNFTIRFFEEDPNTSGKPKVDWFYSRNVGHVGREAVPSTEFYEYWTAIPDLTLTADTDYWASIVNNSSGATYFWGWATTNYAGANPPSFGDAWERGANGDPWLAPQPVELSFSLTNTIPEPAILLLMGLGLAGFGYQRRRKPVS